MNTTLKHIATLSTGIYAQADILPDTFYLQVNHFSENGYFDSSVKPQLKLANTYHKHILQNDDILFAAKGLNNFAVVYQNSIGQAVASSSFIIIRLLGKAKEIIMAEYLAWYITNSNEIAMFHNQKAASTVPSISISQLATLTINIPDIKTQELIVKIHHLRKHEKEIIKRLEYSKDQLTKNILLNATKNNHE